MNDNRVTWRASSRVFRVALCSIACQATVSSAGDRSAVTDTSGSVVISPMCERFAPIAAPPVVRVAIVMSLTNRSGETQFLATCGGKPTALAYLERRIDAANWVPAYRSLCLISPRENVRRLASGMTLGDTAEIRTVRQDQAYEGMTQLTTDDLAGEYRAVYRVYRSSRRRSTVLRDENLLPLRDRTSRAFRILSPSVTAPDSTSDREYAPKCH